MSGIEVGAVPWLTFDVEVRFEVEEKSLTLEPGLSLGELAYVELYAKLDWDTAGHEVYRLYWELLSIVYRGDGCCGQETTFLANAYFDEGSSGLFDWTMTHVEAEIPLAEDFSFTLGMTFYRTYVRPLTFGFHVNW